MKKPSLVTAFLAFSVVANALWMIFHLVKVTTDFNIEFYRSEEKALATDFVQIRTALKEASQTDVSAELQKLNKYGRIDFAYLQDTGGSPFLISNEKLSSDFQYDVDGSVKILEVNGKSEGAYIGEQWGARTIIIGKVIDLQKAQGPFLRASRGNLLWLLGGNVIIILFLAFYYLRDFFKLARVARWGGLAKVTESLKKSKFHEAQAVGLMFSQAQQQTTDAVESLKMAQQQILPSFLSEMKEGRKLPYEFEAYLVRIDINGSTAAFSNEKLKSIIDHWFNQFFFSSNEIVNRYGGFFHEVIGDEILFYLKCQPGQPELAGQMALACVRDIFAMAHQIDAQIDRDLKYSFRLKAAMDFGTLKVAQGFRGLRIMGMPPRNILVSTTRMLDLVVDKTINSCVIPAKFIGAQAVLVANPVAMSSENYLVSEFKNLALDVAPANLLYRSDESIMEICKHLETVESEAYALNWISLLSQVRVLQLAPEAVDKIVATLTTFAGKKWWRASSSFTMVLTKIIPPAQVSEKLERVLVSLMVGSDSRAQANAIEAWNLFGRDMQVIDKNSDQWQHPRSLANAIVAVLLQGLDVKYLKLLKKMFAGGNPSMQASACYALEMTVRHYGQTDAVILETNSELQQLIKLSGTLEVSGNPMLTRRVELLNKTLSEFYSARKAA